MTKHLVKFLIVAFLFLGCEKTILYTDYPTVINKLSAETLNQSRLTFSANNNFLISSLSEFGFCGFADDILNADSPPALLPLTESEAIEVARNFIARNPSTTGVSKIDELTFYQKSFSTDYADGGTGWNLKSFYQMVDNIEVMYSEIIIGIKNREVQYCIGNWFPDIYIPKKFNFNQEEAKKALVNKTVSHFTFGGDQYNVTISEADLDKSTIKLKILPVTTDTRIELRVSWQLNIPGPVFYIIYVDVMTGEVIGEQPTIIS
jgi:hypothetical protein